eukprot:GFKZ01001398.1.p1 GENE.GFKZ01001398.1~~GFKZ01001398.1.p1  ORF type:complete len:1053 (-),score=241.78 GFKZ01001398.1:4707-7775(-)
MSSQPSPPPPTSPRDAPPALTSHSPSPPNPSANSNTMPASPSASAKELPSNPPAASANSEAPGMQTEDPPPTRDVRSPVGGEAANKTAEAKHQSPAQSLGGPGNAGGAKDGEEKTSESELGKGDTLDGGEGGGSRDGLLSAKGREDGRDRPESVPRAVVENSEGEDGKGVDKAQLEREGSGTHDVVDGKASTVGALKDGNAANGGGIEEGEEEGVTEDRAGESARDVNGGREEGGMGGEGRETEGGPNEQRNESAEGTVTGDAAESAVLLMSVGEDKDAGDGKGTAKEAEENLGRGEEMQVGLEHGTGSTTTNKTAERQLKSDTNQEESSTGEKKEAPEPMVVEKPKTVDKGTEHTSVEESASEERQTDAPPRSSSGTGKESKLDVVMTVAEEESPKTAANDPVPMEKESTTNEIVGSKASEVDGDEANGSDRNISEASSPKRPRRASQRNLRSQLPTSGDEKMGTSPGGDDKKESNETKGEQSGGDDGKLEMGKDGREEGKGDVNGDAGEVEDAEKEAAKKKIARMLQELPRPEMTEHGMRMKLGEALFATYDQLEDVKKKRMQDKDLTPIEKLTFADLASFNRDQLRCYCFIYGTPRRKKSEMEIDMAMFVCLWHRGEEGYVLPDYVPKNSKDRIGEKAAIHSFEMGLEMAKGPPQLNSTPEKSDGDPMEITRQTRRSSGNSRSELSRDSLDGLKTPRVGGRTSSRQPGKLAGKAPAAGFTPTSAKRPPPRPQNSQNIHHSPMRQGAHQSQLGTERAVNRGGMGGSNTQNPDLQRQMHGNIQGSSATGRGHAAGTARTSRSGIPVQPMPQGFGTSFKQKIHARAAGEKFKAAYNGAGPSIVNVVENAAAYFTGKDSPEVIQDQAKSYARYQFNVDLLSEIFDGTPPEEDQNGMDVDGPDLPNRRPEGVLKSNAMREVAKRMRSSSSPGYDEEELELWEASFKQLENDTKETERANMRLFQRLERAETEEEINSVKRDFERYHNVRVDELPPPLVRRKLDKSLAPVLMPDNQCRILRFKVA